MNKFLNNILFFFILTSGFYGCNSNNSKENNGNNNVSIKDTIIEMNNETPNNLDSSETIAINNNKINLNEENINSISDIFKKYRKKASIFTINSRKDTIIKCKEGTIITIPANSFERTNNQTLLDGNIKLCIYEYYTISDILLANLTTSSRGNMIETGGMFFLLATGKDSNDSLKLKKGKDITIAIPTPQTKNTDGMQLFNGVHDSSGINWELNNGITGFAQRWRAGIRNFSMNSNIDKSFIFPDLLPKKTPALIYNSQQTYTTEILMPIRELIQNNSEIIRGALGFIDTLGILHGYLTGNKKNKFVFKTDYTPSVSENITVNVAVSFKVKMKKKSDVNIYFFDKLFKMGKGNPDSLVSVILTFTPKIKKINYEKINSAYNNKAIGVSTYKNRLLKIRKSQLVYEKHIKLLETSPLSNINTAKEYLLLSTQKLGWINCDRFYNNTNNINYLVKLNQEANLLIVFNNIKSILSSDSKGIFHNVPLGEKITIVALKTYQGKIMLAMHETFISEKPFENLQFKYITLKEYKLKLQNLNSI